MNKKLAICAAAGIFTFAGALSLATPSAAVAFNACPDNWMAQCYREVKHVPEGCYVTGTCTVNPSTGEATISCGVGC